MVGESSERIKKRKLTTEIVLNVLNSNKEQIQQWRCLVGSKEDVFEVIAEILYELNEGESIIIAPQSKTAYENLPQVSEVLTDKK